MTFVIGVDVGSQSVKAVVVDPEGVVRGTASHALTMAHPRGGWAEQRPGDWETAIAAVIAGSLSEARVPATSVGVMNLACQVDGVVPISNRGEALGPAIIWLDRRAEAQTQALVERVGAERLREITGLIADPSHSGPKIMWLRDHLPDVFASACAFPPAAGYLLHRLTGELAIDHANASSSLLYDLRSASWSPELLEAAGLLERQLGRLLHASDVVGTLSEEGAKWTGLSTSCRVLVGTGDDHAGSIGAGAITTGVIADITGTAEPVTVASTTFVIDRDGLVETHAHALKETFLVENPGFVSGGSTLWLAQNVLGVSQGELFDLAAQAPPGCEGVLFLPSLSGAMAPRWTGQMRGAFAGLAMSHSAAHLARAVLEGCAFALRDIVDRFAALGLGGEEIRVVGGGAASSLWMQIKADVTNRPVRGVLARQATALGAAMLAGVSAGSFDNLGDAVQRTVELAPEPYEACRETVAVYDDAYARYRSLFDGVEGALA